MQSITRAEAAAAGGRRYFTGKPCKRGHVARRIVRTGACEECERDRKAAYLQTAQGKAANREWARRSRASNEAHREQNRSRARRWKQENRDVAQERRRRADWRSKGLPEPTRERPTGCEICGKTAEQQGKALALDHCHDTNRFRGWLCDHCNRGLGFLGDNLDSLRAAVRYLESAST